LANTHVLTLVNGNGKESRKLHGTERLLLRTGPNLTSWRVGELERFSLQHGEDGASPFAYIHDKRGARFEVLPPGASVQLGDDRWPVSELFELVLERIPEPVEPEALYPEPGTIRLEFVNGTTQQLEKVARVHAVNPDGTTELLHETPELLPAVTV